MSKFKKTNSDYEKELNEFFQIDTEHSGDIGLETEYVLDDYDRTLTSVAYDEVGLDTTIMDPEELKQIMGNEFMHVINHFKKTEDTDWNSALCGCHRCLRKLISGTS